MRRLISIAATTFVSAALLAAGNVAPEHVQAAHQQKLQTVRVGYIPVVNLIDLYVAVQRGYFRQAGIQAQLTPMAGGAVILPAMQGGSIDIGISNPVSQLLAASHGIQTVMVSHAIFEVSTHPTMAVLVSRDSAIHSAKDLEGKTVALNTLKGLAQLSFDEWMTTQGANPSTVNFTELDFSQMLATLVHHQVDAVTETEPYVTIGKSSGARVLAYDEARKGHRTMTASFVALRPWAQTHPHLVKRFAQAYAKAQKWTNEHSRQARTYLLKYIHIRAQVANKIALPLVTGVQPRDLTYWMQILIRQHLLSQPLDVNSLIWPSAR